MTNERLTPAVHKVQQQESADLQAQPDVGQVQRFWEANPLSTLENPFQVGTREFFDWQDQWRRSDVETSSMHLYEFDRHAGERVLDVGCGVGWLCWHFASRGADIIGVDITRRGLELTRQRLGLDGLHCTLVQANAEQLPFQTGSFDFVTCAGVLHHTPDTLQAIREIYRILQPGGQAMISLYYKNWLLSRRIWPLTRLLVRTLLGHLPNRSAFRQVCTVDDFVRIYDGDENPLGKSYSRHEVLALLRDFTVERLETHYFPRRFLPLGRLLPRWLHHMLDRYCGLVIYASLRKDT